MLGIFQDGDKLTSCWSAQLFNGSESGATVGYDGVTDIVVGKADGPMGFYAVAQVFRGDELWVCYPLHMMESIEIAPRKPKEDA